jgi:uncharacterized protein (TIGR02145 family)
MKKMMKSLLSAFAIMFGITVGSVSQNNFIEITFNATYMGEPVTLDSIYVQNLTQGGDTILTSTELELIFNITGLQSPDFYMQKEFDITRNAPNPFSDMTRFDLNLPDDGNIKIIVSNLIGQNVASIERRLEAGKHAFTFFPGKDRLYILTASFNGLSKSIKMVSDGKGQSTDAGLVYSGMETGFPIQKAKSANGGFQFMPGDQLRFAGFANTPTFSLGSGEIEDAPLISQEYTFEIVEGIRCPGMPTITDIDGNVYHTVLIGDQCWMKENLKTTTYRNGWPIPNITSNTGWANLLSGSYTWYNNEVNWKDKYGALYNWYAVNDTSGLCPDGWQVPSWDEWISLNNYTGGIPANNGMKLKSCRQVNSPLGGDCNTAEHPRWNFLNASVYGTDVYGFSGLPGGSRLQTGVFFLIDQNSYWWSRTQNSDWGAYLSSLDYSANHLDIADSFKKAGLSVRCIKSDAASGPVAAFMATPTTGTAPLNVSFTDQSTGNPTSWLWDFGDGATSTLQNPTHTYNLPGSYDVQLTVTSINGSGSELKNSYISVSAGNGVPCPGTPTVTDIDGNLYNTVLIGDQCWMKENLKTTTYRNGTPIPNVVSDNDWFNLASGAFAWYDHNVGWKDLYGVLYNWFAVVDTNGLCPEGWHMPSHNEWTTLTDFIGGTSSPNGNKLKSCRQVNSPLGGDCSVSDHPRWDQASVYGTDDFGFSALPGGFRNSLGLFFQLGYTAGFWSSTEASAQYSWIRSIEAGAGSIIVTDRFKKVGYPVRCLRN